MRAMLLGLLCWACLAVSSQAEPEDFQATIDRQITAFLADDFEKAFSFATPSLRTYFRTPENFRAMVTQGYPMVWRPDQVEYLDYREEGGAFFQKVQIIDQQGALHILEYRMVVEEGGWRIGGVRILDASDFAA